MQATGIVAEYNPFHNGHLYHLNTTKKITGQPTIVVMSASFMQRGEPACLSKWLRARLAIENGADLVFELPAAFTLRSAEFFAKGAVAMLAATGCVNCLSCGAENPKADFLSMAKTATAPETAVKLREMLAKGYSYAFAWSKILPLTIPVSPNDILALEYSKALLKTNITPIFIKRQKADYHSTELNDNWGSATAIRQALESGNPAWEQAVPPIVAETIKKEHPVYAKKLLGELLSYRLRLLGPDEIAQHCQTSEGLKHVLKRAADATDWEAAVKCCVNKRYPASRIRRLFLQLLTDKPRYFFEQPQPAYLRVLAFNETGRQLLHAMKKTTAIPIITRVERKAIYADTPLALQLKLEITATDLWSLLQADSGKRITGLDYATAPAYVKNTVC